MTDFRALCDELLEALYYETGATSGDWTMLRAKAEAALAQPEPQGPVPVIERLPGPEDCDVDGRCWWWDDDEDAWVLHTRLIRLQPWIHWLPHHALPVPQQEVER